MRYQRISKVDKQRLFDSYKRNEDYQDLARQMGIKRTTAWAIVKRAEENDGQVTRPRGGIRQSRVKTTDETARVAVSIVEEHPEFTLEQIRAELRRRLPNQLPIGKTTLANLLSGQLIVMKKLEDAPRERNTDAVKDERFAFADWIMREGIQKHLIFVDEAGINLHTKRTRGRAHRGQRAVRVVNGRRGANFTMTFAVSATHGLLHHDLMDGAMTCQRFQEFLQNLFQQLPHDGPDHVIIFDNAPVHRRAIEAEVPRNCALRWLPPYSPFLNVVENSFAKWKANVKRDLAEAREAMLLLPHNERMATLAQLAEQNAVVSAEDAMAFFRHLQSYLPSCLTRSDIVM